MGSIKSRKQGLLSIVAVIVSIIFGLTERAACEEAEKIPPGLYKGSLVARKDFDVSSDWAPKKIMGKECWNFLRSYTRAEMKRIEKEPMVKEAGRRYYFAKFHEKADDANKPGIVSAQVFEKLNPNPDVPFYIYTVSTRFPFVFLDDYVVEKAGYLKWKSEHPNFIGFWGGVEWDNEYINAGLIRPDERLEKENPPKRVLERIEKEFRNPKDREQAVVGLKKIYEAIRKYCFDDPDKLIFLRAGWSFDHYALEWGAGMPWSETTATGNYRHQVSLFFIRGAARQYQKPWGWYIALFYNGYDENGVFSTNNSPYYVRRTRENSGPEYGPAPSLDKRDRYLAYLSGASTVQSESWPQAYCQDKDNDGVWELSPYGEVMKEWYSFINKHTDRGVSYTPVALLLPFSHGRSMMGGSQPWSFFKPQRHDYMIDGFMYTIVPQSQELKKGRHGCLSNSRYGDIYDVIVPNPPSGPVPLKTLSNYKVACLLGKHDIDKVFAKRLTEYVEQGGTLLINIKQVNENIPESFLGAKATRKTSAVMGWRTKSLLDGKTYYFPDNYEYEQVELKGAQPVLVDSADNVMACVHRYGKGNVILTTVDYLIPKFNLNRIHTADSECIFISLLLGRIVKEALPLEVAGDIEYGLNKLEDGWLVYLINNKGVYKYSRSPQKLDLKETKTVKVMLRDIKPKQITELREDRKIHWDRKKNCFSIDVCPGDVRIVKIEAIPKS